MADLIYAPGAKKQVKKAGWFSGKRVRDWLSVQLILSVLVILLTQISVWLALGVAIAALIWIFKPQRFEYRSVDRKKTGAVAEDYVASELSEFLDDKWIMAQNVYVPNPRSGNGRTEVDLMLIGPDRVWLVEVKNVKGYIDAKYWKMMRPSGAYSMRDPSRQVYQQKRALERYLEKSGVQADVGVAVIFPNSDTKLSRNQAFKKIRLFQSVPQLAGYILANSKEPTSEQHRVLFALESVLNKS